MRTLQLAITWISMGEEHVKAVTEVAYVSNVLGMDVRTPCCSFDVSAPYKEGNTLEQYEAELTANAKEFITGLYKELVCGGEMHSEIVFAPTKILLSDVKINYDSNTPSPQELAERIEKLEKSMGNSESLQAMYDIGKKAAADFCQQKHEQSSRLSDDILRCTKKAAKEMEKRPNNEALENFLKRFKPTEGNFISHSYKGFHEVIEQSFKEVPSIFNAIPVSIEIDANPIAAKLVPVGIEAFRHESNYPEGTFTKIGPFYLQVQR